MRSLRFLLVSLASRVFTASARESAVAAADSWTVVCISDGTRIPSVCLPFGF